MEGSAWMKSATEHWEQKPFSKWVHSKRREKKLCETIRWEKKCHLQLSVWINENLLEYKASSSENSELENWKENGYEIGKWSILCLFLVFFFPFSFELRFCMKILLFRCVSDRWRTTPNQKTIFTRKKNHFKRFWLAENWKNYSERLYWTIPSAVHAFFMYRDKRLNLFSVFLCWRFRAI